METILEVKLETSSLLFTCKNRRWDLDDRTLRLKFFNSWPWLPAGTTLNEAKTFSLRLWSRKSLALSKVRKSSFKLPPPPLTHTIQSRASLTWGLGARLGLLNKSLELFFHLKIVFVQTSDNSTSTNITQSIILPPSWSKREICVSFWNGGEFRGKH